jgi:hypothetical protein
VKQISARAFRVAFPKLTEPVTVSTRGEGGEIRMLGTWTPVATEAPRAIIDLGPRPIRPVPKPSRR